MSPDESLSPQERKRLARHEELLAAARKLFITGGLAALGIEQLRKATGYSRPTIYGHFASRNAVLVALAQRNLQVTGELMAKARGFGGSTRERALGLILAYEVMARFEASEFHVTEALGMPWVRSVLDEEVGGQFAAMVASYSNSLTELVELAVAAGELDLPGSMTVGNVVFHSLSMTYGVYTSIIKERIILKLSQPVDPWVESRHALHAFWDGIGWSAKSDEVDYTEVAERFLKEVFPEQWLELVVADAKRESGLDDEAVG